MKQVIWQTGLRVIKQVLDWFQDGGQNSDRTRRQDYSDKGIFSDLIYTFLTGTVTFANGSSTVTGSGTAFLSELKPGDTVSDAGGIVTGVVNAVSTNTSFTLTSNWTGSSGSTASAQRIDPQFAIVIGDNNNPPITHSINVRAGVAYDSNADRVVISTPISIYNPSNPTSTSADGIGGTVVTPLSTGSVNIPLTANTLNYVWIDYLNTTDTSSFTIQKSSGKKQYYKADDGFKITVTTTSTPPLASSLLLGTINLTGFGVVSPSTISIAGRNLAGLKYGRVKVKTAKADRSNATATYTADTEILIDAHVKAVGTGTVTATNPHGMTPVDIGLNTAEILETHQKFMHSSGIVGSTVSITSSLYLTPTIITPGEDYVTIQPLTSSEIALINGVTATSADIPNAVVLLFSSSVDATGTYWVYLDKTTKTIQRTNVNPTSDATKLTLWSFLWTADPFGLPQNGNITSIVDLRVFGTLNNDNIDHEDTYTLKIVQLEDGSVSVPALSFQSDTDTGIYRSASGVLSFTSNGVLSANISGGQVTALNGTALLPSYSFLTDTDTGIYLAAANSLAFTTNGTLRGRFTTSGFNVDSGDFFMNTGTIQNQDGSASTPTYTFQSDPDTGIYRSSSGVLSFTSNGTLSANISGGQVAAVDGSVSTPAYSFLNDTNTGFYRITTDTIGATAGGTLKWFTDTTGLTINSGILFNLDGAVGTPTYTFTGDTNTGIYRIGADQLGVTAGGTQAANFGTNTTNLLAGGSTKLQINTTNVTSTTNFYNIDGTAAAPAYTFTNDTDTGIYRSGANSIDFSTSGSIRLEIGPGSTTVFLGAGGAFQVTGGSVGWAVSNSNGQMSSSTQSAFTVGTQQRANLTGDGTLYTYPSYDNLIVGQGYNRGGDMNSGTGVYTTPNEGMYTFTAIAEVTGFAADHVGQEVQLKISATGSDGSGHAGSVILGSQVVRATTDTIHVNGAACIALNSGAQVFLQVQGNGTSKTQDVRLTFFSGAFLC